MDHQNLYLNDREQAMRFILALFMLATCTSASSGAADAPAAEFLKRIAGVYKERFDNGDVAGGTYSSENILEIVPIDERAAYVSMHLEFFNGHVGDIYGIALHTGHNSLRYDNGEPGDLRCVVEFVWENSRVITEVNVNTPGCRQYHGSRGGLGNAEFRIAARRPIRYLQRIRNSVEFKTALMKYQSSGR